MQSKIVSSSAQTAPEIADAATGAGPPHAPDTRVRGRRLVIARTGWAAAAGILVVLYILLLPACLLQLQTVCSGPSCALVQPSPTSARILQQLDLTVGGYAALTVSLLVLSSLFAFAVAGVIVWRKSDDWMALLVALSQVALGTELVPYLLQTSSSTWQLLALVMNALAFAVLFLVFAQFPTGHFVPRWVGWMVIGWCAASGLFIVSYVLTGELQFTTVTLVWLAVLSGITGAQVYRYRSVSNPLERAQTRWVIFGGVIALGVIIADFAPTYLFPALRQSGSLYLLASAPVYTLPIILFSICLGVAILRYRLYDIDVIIRRTLVYGVVTATLVAVYFGSVVVLQAAFHALTNQGSTLAVVASTLAIAALFQPLRRRVQAAVDRHFYRRKYDAERTLSAFVATVQGEMDLDELTAQLVSVVEETMHPSHVTFWLAMPQRVVNQGPEQVEPHREE
jgi:hypothetical protein